MISTPAYQKTSDLNNWRHFAEMGAAADTPPKVIVKGEGCYLIDSDGNRYLDGLSNLFCVNLGYSYGEELGEAALAQYKELGYHSNWGSTHPRAIELAAAVAELAPGDLSHVYFTPSGGESVEAAWKIARQYYRLRGENRWKAISRQTAYHGTTLGALSLIGIPEFRSDFEPLVPTAGKIRNTRRVGRPAGETEEQFTAFLLDELEFRIQAEGPDTVAMILMEPVQNHGGMLVPPAGYSRGVREIADRYGILLVADETITAFGRVGAWFASERYEVQPDIITCAKGLSSAHAVIGAVIVGEKVYEPFTGAGTSLLHGNTFGGHPVMAAVALKNIEIMKRLDIPNTVLANEETLRAKLDTLAQLPVVIDVRGAGHFYAVELTQNTPSGRAMTVEEKKFLYGDALLAHALEERGVMLRISLDAGDPVVCVAPPLVAGDAEFSQLTDALRAVLGHISTVHADM
ncbi:aspartate aminotransferase family protein [Mycobacterium sp. MS1601]|uniref:aminotransferase class III-fold pyridoxal phosphate-dependent enzyme n=1 Tax=Mycobacterium sp. MS1601 TaxID=1936029 RepID=UPI0009796740|nr:aminotransferase class III-fold pyridoxal phosphate-dependent enzyme [Mycobacterium sp. MS1601]AQA04583.1 aspartate aminotransferase family protein [Mycobacterium sp. MS1601]